MKLSSLPFGATLEALMECFPNAKHNSPCLHHYTNSWSSSLTFRYGRYFMIISTATQAMMGKVMEKTRLEQMKPRELPWPPRLPPLKSSDHCSPALWWSLFIFNIELRKVGLEVGGLIH
jgi:hypothetical protein